MSGTIEQGALAAALHDPDAPPLVVTGPAQPQRDSHPLVLSVGDFGD